MLFKRHMCIEAEGNSRFIQTKKKIIISNLLHLKPLNKQH